MNGCMMKVEDYALCKWIYSRNLGGDESEF